ncbi:type I secretion system permease/ATPase [Thalassospira lucentensis]|uniref:type I secretion system permease/ATPase n=1 Tax=Thalassospira lucentensis TaxID=168935 RepID=UPI003D2BC849
MSNVFNAFRQRRDRKTRANQPKPATDNLDPSDISGDVPGSVSEDLISPVEDAETGERRFDHPVDPLEACLLYLCRHYDMPVSPSMVRAGITGTDQVMSPGQFTAIASKIGFACAAGKQALGNLSNPVLPVVILMDDGRALVVTERLAEDRFAVFHAAFGDRPVQMALADLAHGYSGYVIAVRPEHRSASNGIQSAEEKTRKHWFWGPLAANRGTYLQVILAACLTNILSIAVSIFIMVVYDRILPNEAFESLIALTIGVATAIGFDFLIKMLRAGFIDAAGKNADLAMGGRIFDHLLDMQMRSRKGSAGSFANTLREFETLRDFFASATLVAVVDLPFIFLFLFVIYMIGGPLAFIPMVAVPLVLFLGVAIQPFLARYAEQAFAEGQTKQGVLIETISGLETIKTAGAGPLMRKRWEDSIIHQSGVGAKTRRISQLAINATAFAQQATQVGIIFVGVFLIASGDISMGALVACVILVGRALAPLAQLAQTMTRINQARTSYRNLDTLMKEPTERRVDRRYVSRPRLAGKIEFRDVSFSYPDQSVKALNRVSFTVEPGEKVALLGRIGSGKSTIMRLLLGLYEPDDGSILIDDADMAQIDPADLRANVSAVLQDVWLFTGSVRQNIAIGTRRPTDEQILNAARVSGADDFISQHPEGYDMVLSERGEGLSGGQRQSITLARALIAEAPVLVMDEPTSMMDSGSEQALIERLKEYGVGKTMVLVTHRTSLLDLVDRVIVLDRGRIVADGPKSILSKAQGKAAKQAGEAPKAASMSGEL